MRTEVWVPASTARAVSWMKTGSLAELWPAMRATWSRVAALPKRRRIVAA